MLNFLKSLFDIETPRFTTGARVNRFNKGSIDRLDGRVVAQTDEGVLVDWPRFGSGWEQPHKLCQQV
ncbi:hypothetical protein [Hydrogenophaga sp. ZJX-1]|uniref:hypothetical protein n=1 Tax=Hydrogenophaga sp. ZJX-1 TaxID=3404778 RepID=UPI003B2825D8